VGEHHEPIGPLKLYVDDQMVATDEIRTVLGHFSLCGDRVSTTYPHRFEFTGGRVVKVVFDVADDAYIDVERHFAAALARD
jgi:arylsulfatase